MSHSIVVTMIADQEISILGEETNVHDLSVIDVNECGHIIGCVTCLPGKAKMPTRQNAEEMACSGLTTAALEACAAAGGVKALVEALTGYLNDDDFHAASACAGALECDCDLCTNARAILAPFVEVNNDE
jgi:hypothetical protein